MSEQLRNATNDASMLELYADSYDRMGQEARVLAKDVAYDIRHNMIPALSARSASGSRNIGQEIIDGLEEIKSGKPLKTTVIPSATGAIDLLRVAACPNCDGSGAIPHQISDRGDYELEQCQWCFERNMLVGDTADSRISKEKSDG